MTSDQTEIAILERRGKVLQECVEIVTELAKSPLADHDEEGESDETEVLKRLIIRARTLELDL